MKVRLLWVAWGAAVVMAVVVLVAAFWANRANDPAPVPAQVHRGPRVLPVIAVPHGAALVPRRHTPFPAIDVAGGVTPVASGP